MNSEIVKKLNEVIASISSPMTQINKGRKVAEIKRRLNEIVCSPTVVLVCGEFKRGKSTFVNALSYGHGNMYVSGVCYKIRRKS